MRGMERLRKVSELNTILPKVRETIKKEKRIKQLKRELEGNKVIPELIDSYKKEIAELTAQCNSENASYKVVVESVAKPEGFMQKNDLQEEFLEEYIYLLIVNESLNKKFSMETFFHDLDMIEEFHDMVCKKFSVWQAEICYEIYYERANKEMFLKLFK